MKFYVTYVGTDREVMVTREHNGTVLYLSHVIAKSEPLRYPVETGEAVCRALTAAPFMFEEARWIQRKQDQTPTGKPMSMFHAPKLHDPSYDTTPVYAPLRRVVGRGSSMALKSV